MASSKTMQSSKKDEFAASTTNAGQEEDLLASMGSGDASANDDDLLDSVDASAAPAWRPTEDGEGIVGEVTAISSIQSDYADAEGNRPWCPMITIRQRDGQQWRIVGYQSVLRGELSSADPKVGDTLAVKFFGKQSTKDGKRGYANYGVKIRRA